MTERSISVGTPVVVESRSPSTQYAVVFEDDGETGYFYGLDSRREVGPVVAALNIYNVSAVKDRARPSVVRVLWSPDGGKSVLFINDYPHAVFDFLRRRGYCRTNFPPADKRWTDHDYAWDDRVMTWFK